MSPIFLLAWRYIAYHRIKTVILVACLTLTVSLPVSMQMLVSRFQEQLLERARTTPLVIGAKGSRFDLVLHALYFEAAEPGTISMAEAERVRGSGYARPIPLLARYRARGFPVLGTTLDYFSFRNLRVARGTQLMHLGDCLLGARVARRLNLGPGDRLLSDPENVFDLAGNYPLDMRVAGVLADSRTPDDRAVFVDLKTAWIIAGIGHGHQDLARPSSDPNLELARTESQVVASAALVQYTRITEQNRASFHFHGRPESFPLTAVLAVPPDERSGVLLAGRYQGAEAPAQILTPVEVVRELMELVFRVKRFFDLGAVLIGTVTGLLIALVILLSLRLRRREMETMFKLGCSRFTIFRLQAAELSLVAAISLVLAAGLCGATLPWAPALLRQVLLR